MKFEWEVIDEKLTGACGEVTQRAYVPGGWLVKSLSWKESRDEFENDTQSESMVFVPDSMHLWQPNRDVMDGVL